MGTVGSVGLLYAIAHLGQNSPTVEAKHVGSHWCGKPGFLVTVVPVTEFLTEQNLETTSTLQALYTTSFVTCQMV